MKTERIEQDIGKLLLARGWTLATAESCTGGLVSHRITDVPGSSRYYLGGVVAYANEVKQNLVGVQKDILEKFGAVSEETALSLVRGVRSLLGSDVGISVTGIAGPGGGTEEKPVGLTWIGISTPLEEYAEKFIWSHDRLANKQASAQAALEMLYDSLMVNAPKEKN